MGFVGAITADLGSIVNELANGWEGRPVYVGCSGNFTVERLLRQKGFTEIHSNDVSIYSCALGRYLAGQWKPVTVQVEQWRWMEEFLKPGLETIATLLLCSEMLKYADRSERFHVRQLKAYHEKFGELHTKTLERVTKALDGVSVNSFYAGDVMEFVEQAPNDAVVVSFPPTYKAGYERLYKKMDEVFEWERPSYELFTGARFMVLAEKMTEKWAWATLRDHEVEGLQPHHRATIQGSVRAKPVYVYAGGGTARIVMPHQKVETVPIPRIEGEMSGELGVVELTAGQLNTLRSEYLSATIAPASANVRLAVVVGGELIGALAFDRSTYLGGWCDAYMMTDLAIQPTIYKRLWKLVLIAAASVEVQYILKTRLNMQVLSIGTTAFTEKAVSMKYRGIFELYSRKDGALNYRTKAGRWTLQDGLTGWIERESQKQKEQSHG